jgi:tetratricopeptide (TPR) repeat protein
VLSASDLHARGLEESNAGRHARARQLFRRALDRADVPDVRAGVLLSLAHVEAERGSVADGLSLCDEALAETDLSPGLTGRITAQQGLLKMRAGDGDAALEAFERALSLVGDETLDAARIHNNRGNVYLQRGVARSAVVEYEQASRIFHACGEEVEAAKAEHNLGSTHLLTGDIVTALLLTDRARKVLAPLSPAYAAACDQERAEVLWAAGQTNDAAETLRSVAKALGAQGMRQRQAEAELTLAQLLLLIDGKEALATARRARGRFMRRGSQVWALRATAISYRAGEKGVEAEQLVTELAEHGLHRDAELVAMHRARELVAAGDLDQAVQALGSVRLRKTSPVTSRLVHREVRAEMSRARRRPADALGHVRSGLAELHDWQSSFGSLDLQSSLVGHGRRLALQGMAIAVQDGRPEVVFEWSERARALASRVTPVRAPNDDEARADLSELRSLQGELSEAEHTGATTAGLERRVNELRRRIRQRQWYGAGSGEVSEPVSMSEVGEGLGSDGVLVAYLGVEDKLVALTMTKDAARVHELGDLRSIRQLLAGMQADLDMSAAHLPTPLRAAVHSSLRERLRDLDDRLVAPLLAGLEGRQVVIVPSGVLAGVPWTLLPGLFGQPLTVPRSATTWLAGRSRAPEYASAGLVAGPRVDRAVEEIEAAVKGWTQATVLTGDEADVEHVGRLAASVDVFHVSAHGRHSADNPLFSGLELADGPWFGYDIDQLDEIPSTVILSSCELGRSSVRWGEETIGMTVAWLHAGADTVIASPALVDDDVACYTLAATHHHLAAGRAPADALATAMVEIGGPVPAPFVCFGSGW